MAAITRADVDGGPSGEIWQPIGLTIELAALTTVILLIVGTPIAWWLARSKAWWKEGVAAVVALPLVLPPTVLGFYLLVALGPDGPGGGSPGCGARERWPSPSPAWSSARCSIRRRSSCSRSATRSRRWATGRWRSRRRCAPRPGGPSGRSRCRWRSRDFSTGAVLGFAHTVGEFGIVLMIGGNIPGKTKVLSVAMFDYVETSQWREANILAGGMALFAFAVILAMTLIEKRFALRRF